MSRPATVFEHETEIRRMCRLQESLAAKKLKAVPCGSLLSSLFKRNLDFLILFRSGLTITPGLKA